MEAFLDAAYAIALSAASDQHHESAIRIAEKLEAEGTGLVTTRAVIKRSGMPFPANGIGNQQLNCCRLLKAILWLKS